jgi:hypothetical protein
MATIKVRQKIAPCIVNGFSLSLRKPIRRCSPHECSEISHAQRKERASKTGVAASVPWCLGALVPWCLGALVPCCLSALVSSSCGFTYGRRFVSKDRAINFCSWGSVSCAAWSLSALSACGEPINRNARIASLLASTFSPRKTAIRVKMAGSPICARDFAGGSVASRST